MYIFINLLRFLAQSQYARPSTCCKRLAPTQYVCNSQHNVNSVRLLLSSPVACPQSITRYWRWSVCGTIRIWFFRLACSVSQP